MRGSINLQSRMKTIVLLPFFAALLCAGCANPVLSPAGPETRSRVLIVHIAGESRTALPPTPSPSTYTISVGRSSAGDLGFRDGFSASDTEFSVPLSDYPKAGDTVVVEGFDSSNVKCAEGSYVLTGPETSVIITLCPSQTETGKVDLSVSFPDTSFPAGQEITAAELSLYRSLADYQTGTVYKFTRYRKDGDYGAGENFVGTSIPINYDDLPSGNYVVKIEFFRFKFVRVSTLIQTIIVRDGLTTNSWDGAGSDTLNWGADKFASSNANLSGISIGGTSVNNFSSTTYSYSEYGTGAPSNKTLAVTPGTQGQTIAVSLNGSPVTNNSLTGMNAVNSIVITVTAPDGFTQQTYTVSYTYQYATEWYVSSASSTPPGNDSSGNGSQTQPYASVTKVLSEISTAYAAAGSTWPGGSSAPVAARINISGTITEAVAINGSGLPPILLTGSDQTTDKIKAITSNRPLTINNATVILGDGLTLTGGTTSSGNGGAAYVSGTFIMNGGSISGNTATNGGGVYITGSGSFTMNGGSISGNKANNDGGGVYVNGNGSIFTMSGGTVSGNNGAYGGGGVMVYSNGKFIMEGGSLNGNSSNKGGGVCLYNGGTFEMKGGSISGNTSTGGDAVDSGGGVQLLLTGNNFTMTGGSISGNSSATSGGGVSITNSSNTFTMNSGTISGNTANQSGGGVYVVGGAFALKGGAISGNTAANGDGGGVWNNGAFTMNTGTIAISGNTAKGSGGGVFVSSGFAMNTGTISGNTADTHGGGVYIYAGNFTMGGGSISGNTTDGNGGGVYFSGNDNFTMSEGAAISGNTAAGTGGGVDFSGANFNMNGGSVSGNTADTHGGGVYVYSGNFTMNTGTIDISGNTTNGSGGGVYFSGGGTFAMNVGTISGNTADGNGGGVYVSNAASVINTTSGVVISGNTAKGEGGGGVFVAGSGSFTMNGGTVKENRTAGPTGLGGGIYVGSGGAFTMNNSDCHVDGNFSRYSGGGVHIAGNGSFTMHNGSVNGNTTGHEGGGVNVNGTFTMNNGDIKDNTSEWSGGGVLIAGAGSSFTMNGGTVNGNNSLRTDNDSVHLQNGGVLNQNGGTIDPDPTE